MNSIKERLKNKEVTIGTWMQIPNSVVAEILSSQGFEWIAIDLEHGSISLNQLPALFNSISKYNSIPFVRVAQNHPKDIKQALDAGAKGIIVPMIESFQQAKDFLKWSSYPPVGNRGIGYSNANLYGKNFLDYFSKINNELVRIVQIESITALKEFEEIVSLSEIDAVMIGPYDLSGSMNLTGQFENPDFIEIIQQFQKIANQYNKPLGTHIILPDPEKINQEIESGKKFIVYSTDAMMLLNQSNINPSQYLRKVIQ